MVFPNRCCVSSEDPYGPLHMGSAMLMFIVALLLQWSTTSQKRKAPFSGKHSWHSKGTMVTIFSHDTMVVPRQAMIQGALKVPENHSPKACAVDFCRCVLFFRTDFCRNCQVRKPRFLNQAISWSLDCLEGRAWTLKIWTKKCCLSHRGRHCDEGLVLLSFFCGFGNLYIFYHVQMQFCIWKSFSLCNMDHGCLGEGVRESRCGCGGQRFRRRGWRSKSHPSLGAIPLVFLLQICDAM